MFSTVAQNAENRIAQAASYGAMHGDAATASAILAHAYAMKDLADALKVLANKQ